MYFNLITVNSRRNNNNTEAEKKIDNEIKINQNDDINTQKDKNNKKKGGIEKSISGVLQNINTKIMPLFLFVLNVTIKNIKENWEILNKIRSNINSPKKLSNI